MCAANIKAGTLGDLKCPHCAEALHPDTIREVVDAEAAESRQQLSSADAAPSRGARAQARAQGAWANPAHLISQLREGAETAVDAASPNVRPRQAPRGY